MPSTIFRTSPKQDRSQDLVDSVLSAASSLLKSSGSAALTTNRIAEKAGVSIGSLYRYFPNKESILVALIDKNLSGHLAALENVLVETRGLSDALTIERGVEKLCALYFDNIAFLSLLFKEAQSARQVELIVLKRSSFEKMIKSILKERGAQRAERFLIRIWAAVHAVMGILHSVVELYPEKIDRDGISKEAVILAQKYLLPLEEIRELGI